MLTVNELKTFVRSGGWAWPGGYPVVLVMTDGEAIDAKCARENYRAIRNDMKLHLRSGWAPDGTMIHWEGEPIQCAHCNKEIPSAYGTAS